MTLSTPYSQEGSGSGSYGAPPTIAVVIPTYNRAHILPRAIESVMNQTAADWELIVVDDGSTDGTAELLRAYRDPRIRYHRTEHQGAAIARNVGAQIATAPFLTFLDSDDEGVADWLEVMIAAFKDDGADIVTCAFELVLPTGENVFRELRDMGPMFGHIRGVFTHSGTWAVRRDIFLQIGGFASGIPASQHTELRYRLLPKAREQNWRIIAINRPLLRYYAKSPDGIRKNDQAVLEAAEYLLEHHRHAMAADPARIGRSHGVAGVRAARLGNARLARHHFAAAARIDPKPKTLLRLLVAWLWPLRPKSWRPRRS